MILKIKRRSFRTHFICKSETNVQQKGALGQLKQKKMVNKSEEASLTGNCMNKTTEAEGTFETVGSNNRATEKDERELSAAGSSW